MLKWTTTSTLRGTQSLEQLDRTPFSNCSRRSSSRPLSGRSGSVADARCAMISATCHQGTEARNRLRQATWCANSITLQSRSRPRKSRRCLSKPVYGPSYTAAFEARPRSHTPCAEEPLGRRSPSFRETLAEKGCDCQHGSTNSTARSQRMTVSCRSHCTIPSPTTSPACLSSAQRHQGTTNRRPRCLSKTQRPTMG